MLHFPYLVGAFTSYLMHAIQQSIRLAKAHGARYRVGPELEVSGYGCEDHFLEQDTFYHCWRAIAHVLTCDGASLTDNILCDIGMPVMHRYTYTHFPPLSLSLSLSTQGSNSTKLDMGLSINKLFHSPICYSVVAFFHSTFLSSDDVRIPFHYQHRNVRYNCRVFILNGKILFIRPKLFLALDGNYREERWFSAWHHKRVVEDYTLPEEIRKITGTKSLITFTEFISMFKHSPQKAKQLFPLGIAIFPPEILQLVCLVNRESLAMSLWLNVSYYQVLRRVRNYSLPTRHTSIWVWLEWRYLEMGPVPIISCVN